MKIREAQETIQRDKDLRQFGTDWPHSGSICRYCKQSWGEHCGNDCPEDMPTDQEIINYMDREQPQRCPLCGSANVEVRYVEHVDWEGYWHTGDMFKCPDCAAEGEYE